MLTTLALYLTLGAGAGIVAGLFGIGGGLTIVPVLVITFQLQGMSEAVLTHMAVATSLATIVVTSISSIRAHHQRGAVRWELVKPQLILGIFVLLVTLQMLLNIKPSAGSKPPSTPELATAGVGIGWVSAIFGIGGGTLMVPYLNWRRVVMQQAVATSAACGLPIALMGALTNIWLGWGEDELPEWSLGYVYLPAFIGIVLASYLTAPIGARWAHSLPQAKLKKIFALFLLAASIYFIINYFY
jgi:uncharacterized membrane protein YfcA